MQDGKVVSAGGGRPFKNVFDALVRTARAEGFAGLYRGFGITFLGSAPASCLYFTTYEVRATCHVDTLTVYRHTLPDANGDALPRRRSRRPSACLKGSSTSSCHTSWVEW